MADFPGDWIAAFSRHYPILADCQISLRYEHTQSPGQIQRLGRKEYEITINHIYQGWSRLEAGILAHELAHIVGHHLLDTLNPLLDNERLTDVLTIWLGGGRLASANISMDRYPQKNGSTLVRQEYLGYLLPEERGYALNKFDVFNKLDIPSKTLGERQKAIPCKNSGHWLCGRCSNELIESEKIFHCPNCAWTGKRSWGRWILSGL